MAFYLGEITNVILYGGGYTTRQYYDYFAELGLRVELIIDSNPGNVKDKFPFCKVIQMDEVAWNKYEHLLVVICLQNGWLHDDIASKLYQCGQRKILFLPTVTNGASAFAMQECYRSFLERTLTKELSIPYYDEVILGGIEDAIIKKDENALTCWISKEFVFSNNRNCSIYLDYYLNRNIACLLPYRDLFGYILGENSFPKEYLDTYRPDNAKKQQELLLDRGRLWNMYEEKLNKNPQYYIHAPATASWNEEGYFNINDGHHRVTYLMLKGWYEFPLRVSVKDYEKYIEYRKNRKWAAIKKEVLAEWNKVSSNLLQWLMESRIEPENILDKSNTEGYFAWQLESSCKKEADVIIGKEKKYDMLILFMQTSLDYKQLLVSLTPEFVVAEACMEKDISGSGYQIYKELYNGYLIGEYRKINVYKR